jgi:hypothetical protein
MTGRAEPITTNRSWIAALSLPISLLCFFTGCISKKEIEQAKASSYDADFAVVFGAVAEATRENYPNLTETPNKGVISTSWHRVHLSGDASDTSASASSRAPAATNPNQNNTFTGDSSFKRFFIRFDIAVAGGRPWRIRLVARAAEWDPGSAVPTELRGAQRPPWLDGRSDALLVAIYRRLTKFAVERPEVVGAELASAADADTGPRSDPKSFSGIPPAAAQELAGLRDEILRRDWSRLRLRFVSDVVWSLSADPGLDVAMALWQADPSALDEMQKALDKGCAPLGKDVICPKEAVTPGFAGYRLTLAQRGEAWKVVSFLTGL